MASPQVMLLIVMLMGGVGVIGSYVQGFIAHPGSVNFLWGKISGPFRSVYTVSMLLSALGYFAFAYFLLFRLVPSEVIVAGTLGFDVFFVVITGMLLFSSLWMPFTYSYVSQYLEELCNRTVVSDGPAELTLVEGSQMRRLRQDHWRMLGNGYCTRPDGVPCEYETICESCTCFSTTVDFLPILQRQKQDIYEQLRRKLHPYEKNR